MESYSIGPQPKFAKLAEMAKANKRVWRKVAKLCQTWHGVAGPRLSMSCYSADRMQNERAMVRNRINYYNLPYEVKQELRAVFA